MVVVVVSRVSLVFTFGPKPQLKFGPSWTIFGFNLINPSLVHSEVRFSFPCLKMKFSTDKTMMASELCDCAACFDKDPITSEVTWLARSKIWNKLFEKSCSNCISSHNSTPLVSMRIYVVQLLLNGWIRNFSIRVPCIIFWKGSSLLVLSFMFCLCSLVFNSVIVCCRRRWSLGLKLRDRLSI